MTSIDTSEAANGEAYPAPAEPARDIYHGLTYEMHRALTLQREDGSWWCPECGWSMK